MSEIRAGFNGLLPRKGRPGIKAAMIEIPPHLPVLIAGPTASGKSALALEIAQIGGGVIINADALQVFDGWQVLTARPDADDLARAPHALYGHVPFDARYSTGAWLRDLAPLLQSRLRPIIVGGTGLNFHALTQGLAEIPATPDSIRAAADQLSLTQLSTGVDPATLARLDTRNRARVQRAWEVQKTTGKPLHLWQDATPPPMLPLSDCIALTLAAPKDWLTPRIVARFDAMLAAGALEEAEQMLPRWDPTLPAAKAIGAPELIAHLQGRITRVAAREAAIIATRQYAKRQRSWFRARHGDWWQISAETADFSATLRIIPR